MRISQRHIKEIFKARYMVKHGQTKKTDRIFFLFLPKNVIKKSRDHTMYFLFIFKVLIFFLI